MGSSKLVVLFLGLISTQVAWTHHCADPDNPYSKIKHCPPDKLHICYGLVEDLQSMTCRCELDENCREPCGFNIFRAWSSPEGSWIRKVPKDPTIPYYGIENYVSCNKNSPVEPRPPHKLEYTMCMCNDHYYSFGFDVTSAQRPNFTQEFKNILKTEKPKVYVLGSENHGHNLPYVENDENYKYRRCTEVSRGEEYDPEGYLGTDWCSLKFCQENNPYGKGNPNATYKVMKCSETCTCFLEPSEQTKRKADVRNVDISY